MSRSTRIFATCAFLCAAPAPALAQPSKESAEAAQKLFDEALALMKAGKYAEACPRLQQSQKLDPGMGTKFRLAECYESAGLVGSAFQLLTEVADDARRAGRTDREAQVRQRVAAVQARVPWMTILVPPAVANLKGLEVKRDGEPVERPDHNKKLAVDPGAHTVTVSAAGKKGWQQSVRALEGGSVEVTVPPLEDEGPGTVAPPPGPAPVPVPTPPALPAENGLGGQRIGAIVIGVVGLGGIAVGSAFGALARSAWNGALAGCKNGDKTDCTAQAVSDGQGASTKAAVSTASFVVGGVALATGVVLWVTAPKRAASTGVYVAPALGPGQAALALGGRFR